MLAKRHHRVSKHYLSFVCFFFLPGYFACLPSHPPAAANSDTLHSLVCLRAMLVNDNEVWGTLTAFSVLEVVHSEVSSSKYIVLGSTLY